MMVRGLLISVLMSATLLAGCAWQGGASQPVQPGGTAVAPAATSGKAEKKKTYAHEVVPDKKPIITQTAPAASAPMAPQSQAAALMNDAQPSEVIGSWQLVQLPPNFLQPTRPTAPFGNPWQWFIFSPVDATGTGRVGVFTQVVAPQVPLNDQTLANAWAANPMFDTYRAAPGAISITPVAITGWSAQGTQTWRTYIVTNAGPMLGMQAIPGDMLMVLTSPQNQPLYYRMLRRVSRVQP